MDTRKLLSSIFLQLALLFSSFSTLCLSNGLANENPIRLVSDFRRNAEVKAIYQFGDSYSDTGNTMWLDPPGTSNRLPYGQAYKPTGRCSDGLLLPDYYATLLNMPFLEPYHKPDANFTRGVNFAVAGATALDASVLHKTFNFSLYSNFPLSLQLTWFKSHLHSFYPDVSERRRKLGESLVLMGEIGSNDYNFAFFQRKSFSSIYEMVPYVIQVIRNAVEEIINLGATQIAVPGNFPIGCFPLYLRLYKTDDLDMYDELNCLTKYNRHTEYYNVQLQKMITVLQKQYPNVAIVYLDYFGALKQILQNPTFFGFDETAIQAACCGTGDNKYNMDLVLVCGKGASVCKNPQQHISWDGIHLTQRTHQVMAKLLQPSLLRAFQNS